MKKILTLLLILALSTIYGQNRVGFYSAFDEDKLADSEWIGLALSDLLVKNIRHGNRATVVDHEEIFQTSLKRGWQIDKVDNISSFDSLKNIFALDYLVSGTYKHQPDKSLSLVLFVHDFKNNKTTPLALQGYSNDISAIVSFVLPKVVKNLNISENTTDLIASQVVEPTIPVDYFRAYYQGVFYLQTKKYLQAATSLEEVFVDNLDNKSVKKRYDEALENLYGNGFFALDLINVDQTRVSDFQRQYLTGKKIALGFSTELLSSNLEQNGTYYTVNINTLIKISPLTMVLVNDAMKIFQSGVKSKVKNDLYDPNAKPEMSNKMETIFERNIGNTQLFIRCFDQTGKMVFQEEQNLKKAFELVYRDETGYTEQKSYKKLFGKQSEIKTRVVVKSLSREIIKKIDRMEIIVR